MSRVVIQGNASGTGDFTIAAPNSNTNRTLTLPDTSGTLVTGDDIAINGITSDYTSGTALNVDSSGRVTTSNQPSFWAYCSADTSINVNAGTQVAFDSERFDVGSNFDTTLYRFTAPVTGKYFFSAGCRVDDVDTAASYYRFRLVVSNKEIGSIIRPLFSADVAYYTRHLSSVFDMDANDTAQVNFVQSAGHSTSHVDSADVYTWFAGYLLG